MCLFLRKEYMYPFPCRTALINCNMLDFKYRAVRAVGYGFYILLKLTRRSPLMNTLGQGCTTHELTP